MQHSSPLEENSSSSFLGAKELLVQWKVVKDIKGTVSVGDVHISWYVDWINIITNLLENLEMTNFLVFELIESSDRKSTHMQSSKIR